MYLGNLRSTQDLAGDLSWLVKALYGRHGRRSARVRRREELGTARTEGREGVKRRWRPSRAVCRGEEE